MTEKLRISYNSLTPQDMQASYQLLHSYTTEHISKVLATTVLPLRVYISYVPATAVWKPAL